MSQEPPVWTEVPALARKIIRDVRLMLGDGIMSEAGLFEIATRAIRAGEDRERKSNVKQ